MLQVIDTNKIQQIIQEYQQTLPKTNQLINELNMFVDYLKEEGLEINPKGTVSENIACYETMLDKTIEIVDHRNALSQTCQQLLQSIESMRRSLLQTIDLITKNQQLNDFHDELLDKLIRLQQKLCEENQKQLKQRFISKNYSEQKRQHEHQLLNETNNFITLKELYQLEDWTGKSVENVVFDSDKDDWNEQTSTFESKILQKRQLIFLIEDTTSNIFGGYVQSLIDSCDGKTFIEDNNSFVFSLRSKGRLKEMSKFEIIDKTKSFILYKPTTKGLFGFGEGRDISVWKKNAAHKSYTTQLSFNYRGNVLSLTGSNNFTPKRIIVLQMK